MHGIRCSFDPAHASLCITRQLIVCLVRQLKRGHDCIDMGLLIIALCDYFNNKILNGMLELTMVHY